MTPAQELRLFCAGVSIPFKEVCFGETPMQFPPQPGGFAGMADEFWRNRYSIQG